MVSVAGARDIRLVLLGCGFLQRGIDPLHEVPDPGGEEKGQEMVKKKRAQIAKKVFFMSGIAILATIRFSFPSKYLNTRLVS